jgi:two-component sensor histidine kinase
MVDPHRIPVNNVPPSVVVERMVVDNVEGMTTSAVAYPPGNGELEFHFIGLSYGAPERVRYRYLLEGFNRQWIDAGERNEAFYTNIPPGTYRFRVQAVNGSGTWNLEGAAVSFTLRPHFYQTIWFILLIGVGFVGVVLLGLFMYKRDRDREVVASQLESELARAQVQILEMQLQPHFLFNTLNSIMVLIRQDPDLASRMVARLSEFLRLTLDSAGMQEVTLRRELEFLEKYLHIERIRFGDRLQIEQHVDPAVLDALVPNLILQPIVENAIRHGVSRRRGQAVISVSAARAHGSVTLHVRDNGVGLPTRTGGGVKEGIGIRNTRQRLRHLYGDDFAFSLDSPPEGGVDVVLTFPFHNGSQ